MHDDRPDFQIHDQKKSIGIEITEFIQSDKAWFDARAEKCTPPRFINEPGVSFYNTRRTSDDIDRIFQQDSSEAEGWPGNFCEIQWAEGIIQTVEKKTDKLRAKTFRKFSQNWLLIYDNSGLFIELPTGKKILMIEHISFWDSYWNQGVIFDAIFILTSSILLTIKKNSFEIFNKEQ